MASAAASETQALIETRGESGGVMALAYMNEDEFRARLDALKLGQERVRRIQRDLMLGPTPDNPEGEDYGVIPGTKKPTLLKPGAEKICNAYGLVASFQETWIEGDGVTSPSLRVRMKCLLHRGSTDGPVVAEGVGAANSWERKHRWRQGQRACPGCGAEGTILRSKQADADGDRGWFCWAKRGGCGAQFASDAPGIVEQNVGEVENKDPYDVENTLLKMAKKRSYVDATLTATATSGLFTQDEDAIRAEAPADPPAKAPQRAAAQPERQPGDDEGDFPDHGETAYAEHQVEPARAQEPPRQQRGGARGGAKPPCPKCGSAKDVIWSKKNAGALYCFPCKSEWRP